MDLDLISFSEAARRLNEGAYTTRPITKSGVLHIAKTDPHWPVPRDKWIKAGRAYLIPWEPVEEFFRNRTHRGRGPGRKHRQSNT